MINLEILKNKKLLGIGCSAFGGSASKKTALQILNTSFNKGIIYYDIARSYGFGEAESIFSQFSQNKRGEIIVTTKFGIVPPKKLPFIGLLTSSIRTINKLVPSIQTSFKNKSRHYLEKSIFTPKLAESSLHTSLKELRSDYIDIYLLHECSSSDMLNEDIKNVLEKAVDSGKIRIWGGTIEDRNELKKVITTEPTLAVQFPFGFDSEYTDVLTNTKVIKLIYSVLSYKTSLSKEQEYLILTSIKSKFPELHFIDNVNELILDIALNELTTGVILLSMKTHSHIDRNLCVFEKGTSSLSKSKEVKNFFLSQISKSVRH